jgi:hypothetical protein
MAHIYPEHLRVDDALPSTDEFEVCSVNGQVGMGVKAKVRFARGTMVSKFVGYLSNSILQHTLQASPNTHLHDPYFVGLLTHSCAPNCVLDMQRLEIWALTDVEEGELLTIDYAATEDVLHRQFACGCGSSACRKWITGRREGANAEGQAYLAGLSTKTVRRLISRVRRSGR